jgi:glycolate oxidase FAD binding subunit
VSARVETPGSAREAAELLASGASVRPRGGGTKWAWAGAAKEPEVVLSTRRLGGVRELNAGDLTAVLGAGVPLAEAQAAFAEAGLMLALDPPGEDDATVGGVVATADSGPLRHRYGAPRDLLLGMTVALADGTVARSGGKVIKNVAGYDLAKLFAGSHGALGTIVEVVVRLHPLPAATATAIGAGDAAGLARAALVLASAPLELERLDVRWAAGRGALLAQAGGVFAAARAARAARLMREAGLDAETHSGDDALWAEQRAGQRAPGGAILRVAGLPAELGRVLAVAERTGATLVGRAGAGTSWLRLDANLVTAVRGDLAPFPCVVTDGPPGLDRFGPRDPALVALERRVRARFDPAGVLA